MGCAASILYPGESLYNAATVGNSREVQKLLAKGVDVNWMDSTGWTPLFAAAQGGHTEVVNMLLGIPSIRVNQATKYGYTALNIASTNGQLEVVKTLLGTPDINIHIECNNGKTALDIAREKGHIACFELLRAHVSPEEQEKEREKGKRVSEIRERIDKAQSERDPSVQNGRCAVEMQKMGQAASTFYRHRHVVNIKPSSS